MTLALPTETGYRAVTKIFSPHMMNDTDTQTIMVEIDI